MGKFDINNEINEDEINVEEVMKKIKGSICNPEGAESFQENITGNPLQFTQPEEPLSESSVQRDLEYINSNWDIQNNNYFISSHRPFVGKFLIRGRDLVHEEVRRYMDPVIWKQTEFNGSTARLLNDASVRLGYYNNKVDQLRSETDSRIGQLRPEFKNGIEQLRSELRDEIKRLQSETDRTIRKEVKSVISSMDLDIESKAWLANVLKGEIEERNRNEEIGSSAASNSIKSSDFSNSIKSSEHGESGINYFRFEEQFRGSREDIKQRQSHFISYFAGCSNVLDIGCGRGEFLELAGEHGIGAKGVDIDENMVDYCLSKGFNVVKDEAVSYLEKLDDRSLDGIFIDQVVEHLEPDYLIRLFQLCFKKLKYGFYIFVETVNPLSLVSFANFYIDMTHKKPVHPYTLKFVLEAAGFRDLETKFFSPVPDYARLKRIPSPENVPEALASIVETNNLNIDMLNNILYGAQDYAVIGKR